MTKPLPEWVLRESMLCDCDGCDYARHMSDALSIAWEALDYYESREDFSKANASQLQAAYDAMRRIEELGK